MPDSHPWIKHLEDRLGIEDPDALDEAALQQFISYAPTDRQTIIEKTEDAIVDADVALRKQSQLHRFTRKMRAAHVALKKANR